ncbi:iron ABC transporter permease [Oscillibacter sp.]|jgi:iron(III) transport system permease protein|uniref:ABC transporter permease n=1 Tax=Oscillibacter sp. TaxID=1945593 RepID=UPI00217031C6|nr:iron ABC transporter permease [Oscillibacter sp.]MCI9240693.1 iron ABC transporter permease [Oscillibacter sp.]
MASGTSIRESVKEMRRLKNEPLLLLAIVAIILFVGFFVVYPVVRVITFPSAQDYAQLFGKARWFKAVKNSLYLTLISTLSCTAVAFLFAYVIARLDVPCKGLFRFVTLLPIVSPPFIVALSYILLFGVQGIVTKGLLGLQVDIYGRLGLWIVQTVTFFPYAYSVIYGVIRSISTNLEYAAYNMGATRWQVFRDVFFPLCRPGIAGGALIAAINVLTDFGNPMMIGGDLALLPTEAYMQISGWYDMKTASVLAVALLVPAMAIFLVNRFWVGKRSYVTITGKEISLNPFPVPKWVKWGLFSLTMFISLFILLVYGTLCYGAFTKAWGYDWSFTLENIQYVFLKGRQIWNSIRYGFLSSLGAAFLAMVLAYIVQKKQVGLNKALDFLAILPGAIPGMFLGIGFVMAFNGKPLELTGTSTIMVLALLFWNIPTCYSAATAGLQQIGNSVEDAALNLGANSFRSFKDVIIPLLKAPFLSGFVLSFLRSVTCLSVVIFLYAPSTTVGTISVMVLVQSGQWGEAAAFTMILIAIAFSVLRLAQYVLGKQGIKLEL